MFNRSVREDMKNTVKPVILSVFNHIELNIFTSSADNYGLLDSAITVLMN